MSELSLPDSRLARRRFNRAGSTYAGASRLEAEVASRMLERLDYVKVAPTRILDAGSGPARDAPALARRYRGARIFALDSAIAMLPTARWLERLVGRKTISVCGVLERLPFASASFELAWSNMALHWAADPLAALRELERVLAPEGLLMFSTLGPDTLKELRAAAGATRVHEFIDMHDVGDMLVAAGFAAPVMDMEMLRIEYASGERLLEDLRSSGQTNARPDRPRGLAGRGFLAEFRRRKASASYEVVYGHAWKRERTAAQPATAKSIRIFKRIP